MLSGGLTIPRLVVQEMRVINSAILNDMVEYRGTGLDATFGALAHPTRRALIERLRGGERRVTELASDFDVSLAAVSRHIGVLDHAGLVRRTVRGREHHLALDARPLAEADDWIDGYRRFWEERLDALDRLLGDSGS
jgi:DNA-binding transcriptional ArsR family regulator